MDKDWFESTKIVAYYLWEYSGHDNALSLWYASEDIACFFEHANILDNGMVDSIKKLGTGSEGYVWFVRNIAYRLHVYTKNPNALYNWRLAEQLLNTPVWVQSTTAMAVMLNTDPDNTINQVHSDLVRSFYGMVKHFYNSQTF